MDALYTAVASARGGRTGEVVSDDGVLDLELAYPKELGGPENGTKTNPEQLFAAGYAACFLNALNRLAREGGAPVEGAEMTARVGIGLDGPKFGLEVTLEGRLPGLSAEDGRALMHAAHEVCPYSRATRGNIEVSLTLVE